MRDGKLARKTFFLNSMSNEKNPNGKFFLIRRIIAFVCLLRLLYVSHKIQITLEPHISNPEIAKQYLFSYLIEASILGAIIMLYMILVLIHDYGFEKIAKLATDIATIKK
jgi:hypothetical protein